MPVEISVHGITIATLSSLIASSVERVIIDATGLTGNWDLDLAFVNRVPDTNGDGPSLLFTALEERIELKVQAARAPVDAVVIDRLERPTTDSAIGSRKIARSTVTPLPDHSSPAPALRRRDIW